MSKADIAHEAGRAAAEHPDATVEGCPFPAGDPQRGAWLEGYSERLDEMPDPAAERRAVRSALEEADA